jgi:hypothetical protein
MKNLTIQDVIKILPLEISVRDDLLKNLDGYPEAQQFDIREICWKAFFDYKAGLEEIKFQEFMMEIEEGKRQLSADLMTQARLAVFQDFTDILNGKREENKQIKEIQEKIKAAMLQVN